ncbi:MAG: YceI family protein [Bacteroidetes bacterium]|nr:YceI family protein [Bacteroidota bacterium]MDA0903357.1 YceI family protein [Bacteroidota bacterium]MDA1242323.1 YceI family protein [Bacteroidota bacterium]
MKNILTLAIAAFLAGSTWATNDNTTRYRVNADASTITWNATKVTGEHSGTVGIQNGFFSVTDGSLVAANVIVDMQSIACTDLEGEWGAKLVNHLNSEDFFHVSEHKTSSFTLREITPLAKADGAATHSVTGDFTIRGITKSVTFTALVSESNSQLTISGSAVLDRSEFDVKYGSGSFFDDLGDNFTVGFNLVADAK